MKVSGAAMTRAQPMPPAIIDAKRLSRRLGWKQLIIVGIDDHNFAGVSYGENKSECAAAGGRLDGFVQQIQHGFSSRTEIVMHPKVWAVLSKRHLAVGLIEELPLFIYGNPVRLDSEIVSLQVGFRSAEPLPDYIMKFLVDATKAAQA